MCGIIGYVGTKEVVPVLMNGLRKLEYRGYDSAGITVLSRDKLILHRCAGKLMNLEQELQKFLIRGKIGLGHTRWATHGKPTRENAHPHTDCKGNFVVVHNGIIENYLTLRRKLIKEGHKFKSDTDTEVIAHLIEKYFKGNLFKATQRALKDLKGSYALGVISIIDPGKIIAARHGSPLIVGMGKKEYFIASDVSAILAYTKDVVFLEDGETAILDFKGVKFFNSYAKEVHKSSRMIEWNAIMAEKGGYKHFMLKEICEQTEVVRDTLRGRICLEKGGVFLEEEIIWGKKEIDEIGKIFIVACGTSYHSGLIGKYVLEDLVQIPCEVDLASEFRYRSPLVKKNDLVIVITQSGETADTLAALREAKKKGVKTLAICNVIDSSITRECDCVLYTRCGPEIGVASTKAFMGQLIVLYLLSLYLAKIKESFSPIKAKEIISALFELPLKIEETIKMQDIIQDYAQRFFKKSDFLYLGRNVNYPIALEGALKLKEIAYIHAEGYAAGEMKHGPIALIDENMPVLVIANQGKVYDKILSNIKEVKARDGIVIVLASKGDRKIHKEVEDVFYLPKTMEILTPVLNVIPLQFLAYYIAVKRGCDVDQPRNLAKSVTVE